MSRGKPFEPGNSFGRGRPKGSRNKSTLAALALLVEHAEALVRKCIAEALKGDMIAMRLCIERILPALREPAIKFKAGATRTSSEVAQVQETIVKDVSKGRIVPQQGERVMNILELRRRVIETKRLEERLEAVEAAFKEDSDPGSRRVELEDAA
jgi:hypothetical protein